jgi:hypothetical protein
VRRLDASTFDALLCLVPTPQHLNVEGFLAMFDRDDYEKVTHSCEYCPSPQLVPSSCMQHQLIRCVPPAATNGT